jgi:hypothetical protein
MEPAESSIRNISSVPRPREKDARHRAGNPEPNKRDRIEGIGLAFDLDRVRRDLHAGLIVQAEHYLAVFGEDIAKDNVAAIGLEPAGLAFKHIRPRALQSEQVQGLPIDTERAGT